MSSFSKTFPMVLSEALSNPGWCAGRANVDGFFYVEKGAANESVGSDPVMGIPNTLFDIMTQDIAIRMPAIWFVSPHGKFPYVPSQADLVSADWGTFPNGGVIIKAWAEAGLGVYSDK